MGLAIYIIIALIFLISGLVILRKNRAVDGKSSKIRILGLLLVIAGVLIILVEVSMFAAIYNLLHSKNFNN